VIFLCEPCGVACFCDCEPQDEHPVCHSCEQGMTPAEESV